MKTKLLISFLFVLSIFLLTACGSDESSSGADTETEQTESATETDDVEEPAETTETTNGVLGELQETGTAVIGFANERPYAYEEGGELKGVAVDSARRIFNELGSVSIEGRTEERCVGLRVRGQGEGV